MNLGEDSVLGFHLVGILAFSLSTQIFFFLATLVLSGFDPLVSVSQATRFYLPINLIRLDDRTKNIFMLIGEGIEIEIKPNGQWIK
ncbi:DUF6888 family protein [Microcystis aeruginosa]|uniref:DUF6888 family protein n=1 Tax=Microcystis aeruginosa TaxID=1126 RepID=UPI00232BAB8B|nr:hypothetical protein [Microcystis aeruginosa]MDB9416947.1 hypothetical protein [Microcystis aeruginosa CS-556/03]